MLVVFSKNELVNNPDNIFILGRKKKGSNKKQNLSAMIKLPRAQYILRTKHRNFQLFVYNRANNGKNSFYFIRLVDVCRKIIFAHNSPSKS